MSGKDINAVEVYTKMTTEWARMVMESFVVNTEREGNWPPTYCCYIHPHIQNPAPHLTLARSTSEVMMTVAGKRGETTQLCTCGYSMEGGG